MVRIRLRRVGAKRQPSYRIVVADRESPRDGRFLEIIGQYNPRAEPAAVKVQEARLFHWLQHGAQPSESVVKILKTTGAWSRWERLRQGEAVEALLLEAAEAATAAGTRTRREDRKPKRASKKTRAKAAGAEAETEGPLEGAAQAEDPLGSAVKAQAPAPPEDSG